MKESFEELKRPIQRLKGFFESLWLHVEPSPCAGLLSELGRWFPLWHNHKAIRKMETSVLSPQPDWPLYPDYPTGTMPTRPVPEKQGNMGRSCVLSALCMNRRLWFSLEFGPTVKCQWHCKTLRHWVTWFCHFTFPNQGDGWPCSLDLTRYILLFRKSLGANNVTLSFKKYIEWKKRSRLIFLLIFWPGFYRL